MISFRKKMHDAEDNMGTSKLVMFEHVKGSKVYQVGPRRTADRCFTQVSERSGANVLKWVDRSNSQPATSTSSALTSSLKPR